MSNAHPVVTAEPNWKYGEDDDYRNKDGSTFGARILKNNNPFLDNDAYEASAENGGIYMSGGVNRNLRNANPFLDTYEAVDENDDYVNINPFLDNVAYEALDENGVSYHHHYINKTNTLNLHHQHEIVENQVDDDYISNEQQQAVETNQQLCHHHRYHHHIDWHDEEIVDSPLLVGEDVNLNTEFENPSYVYEENYDGDDEYSTNLTIEEIGDYYEGAVGGCNDSGGNSHHANNSFWNLDDTGAINIIDLADNNNTDINAQQQNNRFVTEIDESFDSDVSFHFEDIYNESDFELDDGGHIVFKTDSINIEYRYGMTIEEMGKLMEQSKQYITVPKN